MTAPKASRLGGWRRGDGALATALLVPLVVLVGVVVLYPLVLILWTSFQKSTFIHPEAVFNGLANYQVLLRTDLFWQVALQSIYWTVGTVAAQFLIGLGIAILLNQRFHGRALLRVLVLVPWVMPGVVAGILWRFMYDPYLGLVNLVGQGLGLWGGNPALLADSGTAMLAVIVAAIWKGVPFSVLMYLAALQSRPIDQIEAARLDGASTAQSFRFVTLPSMAPVIRATLLLTVIWTFNYFDLIYVMTGGGPNDATEIAPTYIYRLAFVDVNYGKASAYGVLSILVLAVFSLLYLRQLRAGDPQ